MRLVTSAMEDEKHILPALQICACRNSTLSSRKFLALHESSRAISKPRPKIRIIHVFAPEIIKTDVENFRELVQRLTGKPPSEKAFQRKRNHASRTLQGDHDPDRPKVVLGSLSRYYQELEVEEEEEESPWVAIDVSRMHPFEAGQLA